MSCRRVSYLILSNGRATRQRVVHHGAVGGGGGGYERRRGVERLARIARAAAGRGMLCRAAINSAAAMPQTGMRNIMNTNSGGELIWYLRDVRYPGKRASIMPRGKRGHSAVQDLDDLAKQRAERSPSLRVARKAGDCEPPGGQSMRPIPLGRWHLPCTPERHRVGADGDSHLPVGRSQRQTRRPEGLCDARANRRRSSRPVSRH